jgi:hypothetical protein
MTVSRVVRPSQDGSVCVGAFTPTVRPSSRVRHSEGFGGSRSINRKLESGHDELHAERSA